MTRVSPPHEERRPALRTSHLEDLAVTIRFTDAVTLDHDSVTHGCTHGRSPFGRGSIVSLSDSRVGPKVTLGPLIGDLRPFRHRRRHRDTGATDREGRARRAQPRGAERPAPADQGPAPRHPRDVGGVRGAPRRGHGRRRGARPPQGGHGAGHLGRQAMRRLHRLPRQGGRAGRRDLRRGRRAARRRPPDGRRHGQRLRAAGVGGVPRVPGGAGTGIARQARHDRPPITWFEDLGRADTATVGGKGANLGELARAGLPVPPGFVVTAAGVPRRRWTRAASATSCAALFDEARGQVDDPADAGASRPSGCGRSSARPGSRRRWREPVLAAYHRLGHGRRRWRCARRRRPRTRPTRRSPGCTRRSPTSSATTRCSSGWSTAGRRCSASASISYRASRGLDRRAGDRGGRAADGRRPSAPG